MSESTRPDIRSPRAWLVLAAFIVVVVTAGALIGMVTRPGAWYAALDKPPFNPPAGVFAPVWTVLYVLIAVAGWRIWLIAPRSRAMTMWIVQMLLNWAWSPAFFGLQSPGLALAVILALLVAIVLFMIEAKRIDRVSTWLFVPYAAWVAFATLLNGSILAMN